MIEQQKKQIEWINDLVDQCKTDYYLSLKIGSVVTKAWRPANLGEFLDKVESCHTITKERLGGLRKTFEIEPDGTPTVDVEILNKILSGISKIMPEYLVINGLRWSNFLTPNIYSLKNIKCTKHISNYAEKQNLNSVAQEQLNGYIRDLGKLYTTLKPNKEPKYYVTCSIEPEVFCLLGQLNIRNEGSSCFNNGGCNTDKKYALACTPESMVVLFHKQPLPEVSKLRNCPAILGRAIGFLTESGKRYDTCNWANTPDNYTVPQYSTLLSNALLGTKTKNHSNLFTLVKGISYQGCYEHSFVKEGETPKKHNIIFPPNYSLEYKPDGDTWAVNRNKPDEYFMSKAFSKEKLGNYDDFE